MRIVTSHAGEPLDALVWRTTGGAMAAVQATLAANPGLAALGPELPEGTAVLIPDVLPSSAEVELVQLWS